MVRSRRSRQSRPDQRSSVEQPFQPAWLLLVPVAVCPQDSRVPASESPETETRPTCGEHQDIEVGVVQGLAYSEIAERLSRPVSTISREVARNGGRDAYSATRSIRRPGRVPAGVGRPRSR